MNDPPPPENPPNPSNPQMKHVLTLSERNAVLQALLQRSNPDFILQKGAVKKSVAREFNVHCITVS